MSTLVTAALLTCVLLYAGLLRLDALYKSYGPYDRPHWLASLEPAVTSAAASLTPDWPWRRVKEPYVGGDPVNYLKFARDMRNFYAAHVREPGFPGATRIALMLTGNADVAVSLTSITFALLTLVATFALGCALLSPVAGLAAAMALGMDKSAVFWAVGGWRDEMFAFFAVLSAWAWLRLAQHPTSSRGVVAGLVSGGALLTRITSISLLVPAAVFLLARRNPAARPVRYVGVAVATAIALIAPFLINCAIATGDPFYAINNHTAFYLNREGTAEPQPTSAVRYSIDKFNLRPIAAADTVATGIFLYPFENKWAGLEEWLPGLGRLLACLSIAGLVAWLWQREGRLLLLMLLGALVPFSVTWTVIGGAEWRLTLFAYAFQLLAAFWVVDKAVRHAPLLRTLTPRQVLKPIFAVLGIMTVFAGWTYAMPYAVVREALKSGSAATIPAGYRDLWFFDEGWSRMVLTGNVVSRFATMPVATARLLLVDARPYSLMMRLQPLDVADTPQQSVEVAINDHVIGSLELMWNTERIGQYRLEIPAAVVQPGLNQLAFRSHRMRRIGEGREAFPTLKPDQEVAFRLWYVSIVPR
jgi:4-amino-4-deoxy-L-arabinose transferase-like glycosyltransferase